MAHGSRTSPCHASDRIAAHPASSGTCSSIRSSHSSPSCLFSFVVCTNLFAIPVPTTKRPRNARFLGLSPFRILSDGQIVNAHSHEAQRCHRQDKPVNDGAALGTVFASPNQAAYRPALPNTRPTSPENSAASFATILAISHNITPPAAPFAALNFSFATDIHLHLESFR